MLAPTRSTSETTNHALLRLLHHPHRSACLLSHHAEENDGARNPLHNTDERSVTVVRICSTHQEHPAPVIRVLHLKQSAQSTNEPRHQFE